MDDHNIIIRPLITEQGTHLAGKISAYSFEVNKHANKQQIKGAVERLYNVKVDKVRTANRKGKFRRKGRTMGVHPGLEKGRRVSGAGLSYRPVLKQSNKRRSMGIKIYKPTSAGRRNSSVNDFAELTTDRPEKSLCVRIKKAAAETTAV